MHVKLGPGFGEDRRDVFGDSHGPPCAATWVYDCQEAFSDGGHVRLSTSDFVAINSLTCRTSDY
jgi:hypothetical protein